MHIGKIYPIQLNEKTAYLAGVIIGDGYISNSFKGSKSPNCRNYRVYIDLTDFEFISIIADLTKEIIPTNTLIRQKKVPLGHMPSWSFTVTNKSWWHFFTRTLGVPAGKKSRVVTVPQTILTGSSGIKKVFLAGLFDTDGGLRSGAIGLTTASKIMAEQVALLFKEFRFDCRVNSWIIKKYDWRYYGLSFRRRDVDRFLKEIPLRNERKKVAIARRFNIADVPKWSNGPVSANPLALGQI